MAPVVVCQSRSLTELWKEEASIKYERRSFLQIKIHPLMQTFLDFGEDHNQIQFHTLMQTFSDFGSGRPWGLKQGGEITRAAQVSEQFLLEKKRVHIPVHHLPSNISFFAAQCGHLRRIHSREEVEHLK